MNYLAKNLPFLRKEKNQSQARICAQLGFVRNTWSNWENGISEPDLDTTIKIARYFDTDVDALLSSDLSTGNLIEKEESPKNRQKGNPKGNLKGKYQVFPSGLNQVFGSPETTHKVPQMPKVVTVAQSGFDNIIFVPLKAQAGYLLGYEDPEFIETLPSFQMPGLRNGTYRMFEVEGISMTPTIRHGDKVIGEWVSSLSEIREDRVHVLVLKDGVCVKRVLNRVNEREKLYLKSDTVTNQKDHPIREITPDDILEIWYVRMLISSDLRPPTEMYTRLNDLEINQKRILDKLGLTEHQLKQPTP